MTGAAEFNRRIQTNPVGVVARVAVAVGINGGLHVPVNTQFRWCIVFINHHHREREFVTDRRRSGEGHTLGRSHGWNRGVDDTQRGVGGGGIAAEIRDDELDGVRARIGPRFGDAGVGSERFTINDPSTRGDGIIVVAAQAVEGDGLPDIRSPATGNRYGIVGLQPSDRWFGVDHGHLMGGDSGFT